MSTTSPGARDASPGLAHAVALDRALHEITQQLRRTTPCEAVAIALCDDTEPRTFRLVHRTGFDEDDAAVAAARTQLWAAAIDEGRTQTRSTADGQEVIAPMGRRGALSVVLGAVDEPRLGRSAADVAAVAEHAAIALERVEAVQRLAERERIHGMEQLAAGLAHELRNPVFAISSAAQLLRYSVGEDPVIEKNVGRILRETDRLNGMLAALLEYASPIPVRREPGDPDDVWADVLQAHRGELEAKAILVRHVAAEPRAACAIDAEQVAQALSHALRNAIDAAPEGTDLTIESSIGHDDRWRSRLRNTGAPADPEELGRAFEPFFSTKPGHAGLGLAMARRVALAHGGSIGFEPGPADTTTLLLTLPLA